MAVKIFHDDSVFCGGLNEVESIGFVREGLGGVGGGVGGE